MKLAAPILTALLLVGCGNAPSVETEQDVPGEGPNGRRNVAGIEVSISARKNGQSYGA
jgi:hypothetical protein